MTIVGEMQVILASLAEDELQKQRHLRPFTSPSIGTVHGMPGGACTAPARQLEIDLKQPEQSRQKGSCVRQVPHAGTPEAEGKAEYLTSVIDTINEWQGSTIGLAKLFSLARGKLQRHRHGIREVC